MILCSEMAQIPQKKRQTKIERGNAENQVSLPCARRRVQPEKRSKIR